MNLRKILLFLPVACLLILYTRTYASAHQDPKSEVIEKALLQELNPIIKDSLQSIYKEKFTPFTSESILSINERFTMKKDKDKIISVDSVHGAQYFEIWIDLCKPDGDHIQLLLKNDGPEGNYKMVTFKIVEAP